MVDVVEQLHSIRGMTGCGQHERSGRAELQHAGKRAEGRVRQPVRLSDMPLLTVAAGEDHQMREGEVVVQ
jgi:hypothetical protein